MLQTGIRIDILTRILCNKCFAKIMVSKFIKVSAFNENKYKGLNKRKNKSFCS